MEEPKDGGTVARQGRGENFPAVQAWRCSGGAYGLYGAVQSAIWLFNHLCKISQYPLDKKMSNQSTLFGCALEQARVISGLSKRKFAAVSMYELRGIQKILKGEREPGVMLALRLVAATGQDVGDFFAQLNRQYSETVAETVSETGVEALPETVADGAAERLPIPPERTFQRAASRIRPKSKETNRLREKDSCVPS